MLLKALAALLCGQFLPGLLLVELVDFGRSREERWVYAAVLGGPLGALLYFIALWSETPALYGVLCAASSIAGLALAVRFRSKHGFRWPRRSALWLGGIVAVVLIPYLSTTGSLYRLDASGDLLLDRALQRDALFHVGVVRSLQTSPTPSLLSVSGQPVGYHVGYHLQLAAWSRFYGLDPMDGLIRVGTSVHILLLVLSAYVLARRLRGGERARLLFSALVLGSGLGFVFFARPSVDWWSLTFMDVTLVSLFLANPLLPALPLLFVGLGVLEDYLSEGRPGDLAASSIALGSLFAIKMFTGAQVLAALGLASLFGAGRRCWRAFVVLALVCSPLLAHTFLAAEGSNTAIGMRPLEIVRYAMEKIDWSDAVSALANVGRFQPTAAGLAVSALATLLWAVGFLGLRLVGLRGLLEDLFSSRPIAWFAVIGLPLALVFRVAPPEAAGLSRLEAQNDVVWFAAQSGVLLWYWAALTLSRFRVAWAVSLVALLALPATVQHFVYTASLPPDRIGASRVQAALEAARLSPPNAVWLEPLERSRPSLLPYVSGRPVVYDPYVGYDYMFFGREAIDYRRHAVAQFWTSEDLAYQAWVLDRFDVTFVWREGVAEVAPDLLERLYENDDIVLYRVRAPEVERAGRGVLRTPESVPLGGRGHPFLSRGLRPVDRFWSLSADPASLYLPREKDLPLDVTLGLRAPHGAGALVLDGVVVELVSGRESVTFTLPPDNERGLATIVVSWRGEGSLDVISITTAAVAASESAKLLPP